MTDVKERSAGGVVYRKAENGIIQVQLIQDRYGKITLAKGKQEAGETIEQTALREILEETGIHGTIIAPLEVIAYQYAKPDGEVVDKEVHYYLVEGVGGELHAQIEEIRGVEWLEPEAAWRQQQLHGYGNNHSVLRKGLKRLGFNVMGG